MRRDAMWECPACRQLFVTRNMSHSCGRHTLDEHFANRDPSLRALFDALRGAAEAVGPLHVYAQKSRIVFQTRGRFVAVTPRRRHLSGHLWLKRRRPHPAIHRIESLRERDYVHHFRLTDAAQIDRAFRELLAEAYRVGCQEYVAAVVP